METNTIWLIWIVALYICSGAVLFGHIIVENRTLPKKEKTGLFLTLVLCFCNPISWSILMANTIHAKYNNLNKWFWKK